MVACDDQSVYTFFDAENEYAVIKSIQVDFPSQYQHVQFSRDGSLFAITGDNGNYIAIYETGTME